MNPAPISRPTPSPDYVKLVYSDHVQALIESRLARAGILEQDRGDLRQIVNKGLLYMANPPTDLEGCSRAANDITTKQLAGHRRDGFKRGKVDAGPTDQADNHVSEDARELASGHHAQKLATVREALTDGTLTARDAEMLSLKREGLTDAQIAAKLGVAPQTVSNRIALARKKMREKWQKRLAGLAAIAFVAMLAVLAWKKREEVAHLLHLPNTTTPAPAPAPTRPEPEPSIPVATLQQASELRLQASEACRNGDLATCSDRLEAAAKLDPTGDEEPWVRQLRHQVEDSIRPQRQVGAKPGSPR